jgi:hypothetical protein
VDRLGHRVGAVGGHQGHRHVERPDRVVDQGVGGHLVDLQQGGAASGGGLGQLVAPLVGDLDHQPVDDRRVAAGVHVEVDDVGAAGGQVGGHGRQVPRPVGQLHPELVSSHVSQRSSASSISTQA